MNNIIDEIGLSSDESFFLLARHPSGVTVILYQAISKRYCNPKDFLQK